MAIDFSDKVKSFIEKPCAFKDHGGLLRRFRAQYGRAADAVVCPDCGRFFYVPHGVQFGDIIHSECGGSVSDGWFAPIC